MNQKKRSSQFSLYIFLAIFYFSMSISKYVQVLWFDKNNHLINFSLSYTAMAVSGSFVFLFNKITSKISVKKGLYLFVPVYAIGMALRVFTAPFIIPIISGVISGIGASVTLLIVRTWVAQLIEEQKHDKNKIVSYKTAIPDIAGTVAILIAGQIIYLFTNYIIVLILSSVFLLVVIFLKNIPNTHISEKDRLFRNLPSNKELTLAVSVIIACFGFNFSLIEPYLPLVFQKFGKFNPADVGYLTSLYTALAVLSVFVYKSSIFSKKIQVYFFILEMLSAIVFLYLGLFSSGSLIMVNICLLMLFAIFSSGIRIFRELMEYEMFPKKELSLYIGISQSAYLVGDCFGGVLGGALYADVNIKWIFIIISLSCLIVGIFYALIYQFIQSTTN